MTIPKTEPTAIVLRSAGSCCWLRCGAMPAKSWIAAEGVLVPDVHTTLVRTHKARRLLRKERQAVSKRWLCLGLRDSMADLEACAEDHGGTVFEVVRWPRLHSPEAGKTIARF
jgi:hypothetical protein